MIRRPGLGALVALVVALVVVGAALGVAWALLAPSLPVGILPDGSATALDPEGRARFEAAGLFAVGALVVGVVTGVVAWFVVREYRGVPLLLTVVLGSLVAACVAELVGLGVAHLRYAGGLSSAAVGSRTVAAPELGTWAFVLVQPFGAALSHTLLVAFTHDDDLGLPAADRRVDVHPERPDAVPSATPA